jgi:hypothetical protein
MLPAHERFYPDDLAVCEGDDGLVLDPELSVVESPS